MTVSALPTDDIAALRAIAEPDAAIELARDRTAVARRLSVDAVRMVSLDGNAEIAYMQAGQ